MDCRTTRALFSEHYDRRVGGERLIRLQEHLEGCPPCGERWHGYVRVFDLVAASPEPEALRSFSLPPEPPGMMLRLPERQGWTWRRFAAAASILVAFAASNFVIFRIGQGGFGDTSIENPVLKSPGPVVATPATNLRRATRERWRDHLDFTNVTLNQFARLGRGEALEGNELAEAKLAVLSAEDLGDTKLNDLSALGSAQRYAAQYLRAMRALTTNLNLHVNKEPGKPPSEFLEEQWRQQAYLYHLHQAWQKLWAELGGEASGTSWNRRAHQLNYVPEIRSREVRSLLEAEKPFHSARYAQAERGFRSFRSGFPKAKLDGLARYMLWETLSRMRRFEDAQAIAPTVPRPSRQLRIPGGSVIIYQGRLFPPAGSTMTLQSRDGVQIVVNPDHRLIRRGVGPGTFLIELKREVAPPQDKNRRKL